MITCNLMGGLGNQLFQIFATIAYGIKSHNQFKFLNFEQLGGGSTTVRYTFWNTFFANLKIFLVKELPQMYIIKEKGFQYTPLPVYEIINRDIMIYGYFQSYKYFQEQYNVICRMIGIENMKQKLLLKLNISHENLTNTISLHFRIGDYKKLPDFHPIITYEYYEKSLNYIKENNNNTNNSNKYNILYFCEDEDIETVDITIHKLKQIYPTYIFERATNTLADWEQLLLMSCCHHNIIANSSFSWWAAYFNSNCNKIICYPSIWFGASVKNDVKDLCPPEWTKIYC